MSTLPESGYRVRPCAHYFRIKAPADFAIARPESFRDLANFRTMDLVYEVDAPVREVWRAYTTANPLSVWRTARTRVVAVHVPSRARTLDRDALPRGWRGFERGMKVFVDLCALPVAIESAPALMVGLQIVRVSAARREVEFRYLEGAPSYGRQLLAFRASADRRATVIHHRTWFRGHSCVMEWLYPWYHELALRDMHEGFRSVIAGRSGSRRKGAA